MPRIFLTPRIPMTISLPGLNERTMMALFLAFGVAYSLAQYRRTEPVQPGVLAMVLFLRATMPVYYPFFKAWERILVAREEVATQPEESRMRATAEVR